MVRLKESKVILSFIVFIWLQGLFAFLIEAAKRMPTSKRLVKDLLSNYGSRYVRPAINLNTTTYVTFRIIPVWFADFDEKFQKVTFQTANELKWRDELLTWNPEEYDGITELTFGKDQIWFPDIALLERLEVGTAVSNLEETFVVVNNDGEAAYYDMTLLTAFCKMNVRHFPFDTHVCTLRFLAYALPSSQVYISYPNISSVQHLLQQSGVWSVSNYKIEEKDVYYFCCPEAYKEIHFTVDIQRESGFYVTNMGIPTILISFTTVSVFLLHPQSGEKISLCVSNALILLVFQQLLSSNMPPTGDQVPIVAYYFLVIISITFTSVLSTCATVAMYHYDGSVQLPELLRRILFIKEDHVTSGRMRMLKKLPSRPIVTARVTDSDKRSSIKQEYDKSIYLAPDVTCRTSSKETSDSNDVKKIPVQGYVGHGPTIGDNNDAINAVATRKDQWQKAAIRLDILLFITSITIMALTFIFCLYMFMTARREVITPTSW